METRSYIAIIHKEDDGYTAECPELGTSCRGRTVEEAVANLKHVTAQYLDEVDYADPAAPEDDEGKP